MTISALAAAQMTPDEVVPGPIPYPGTINYGSASSFRAIDSDGFRMTTERDPAYGQRAAYRLRFTGVSPQSATLQIQHRTSVSTATLFVYAYNWATQTYDLVGSGSPRSTFLSQSFALTSDQMTKYVDGAGNLYALFRINQPARLGNAPFTWDTDAVSLVSAPAAPSSLTAASDPTISKIDLAWTDNATDETGFRVERQNPGSTAWTTVANLAANTTIWTDTGLAANATYSYRVAALNAAGLSGYSNVASATTLARTGVQYVVAVATSSSSIRIYWGQDVQAPTYQIVRASSLSGLSTGTPVATVSSQAGSIAHYDDRGLTEGQIYYYGVKAVTSSGISSIAGTDSHIPNSEALPFDSSPGRSRTSYPIILRGLRLRRCDGKVAGRSSARHQYRHLPFR